MDPNGSTDPGYNRSQEKQKHVIDNIYARFSCRFFSPQPIDRQTVEQLLEAANQAPSTHNTQPWEYVVLAGEALQGYRDAVMEWLKKPGEKAGPAESEQTGDELDTQLAASGASLPRHLVQRRRLHMKRLKEETAKIGIALKDVYHFTYLCHNAPVVVMVVGDVLQRDKAGLEIDQSIAASIQNLLLAAQAFGMGTCWVGDIMRFGDLLHRHLGIAEGKQVIGAVALGFPDPNIEHKRIQKQGLEGKVQWLGY